jgi:hypothetical protein
VQEELLDGAFDAAAVGVGRRDPLRRVVTAAGACRKATLAPATRNISMSVHESPMATTTRGSMSRSTQATRRAPAVSTPGDGEEAGFVRT